MIIDAHAHACGPFLRGENLIRLLDQTGVDRVILVPGQKDLEKEYSLPNIAGLFPNHDVVPITNALTRLVTKLTGTLHQIPEGNKYVYQLAQCYPDRILQFYWATLNTPGILDQVQAEYVAFQFRGIKLHQCWENFSIGSPIFRAIAKFATQHGLPIFIHMGSYEEVKALIDFIRQSPETIFIIGHLFGMEYYMRSGISFQNVYFEISSPSIVSLTRLKQAIAYFGAHRIVMGSDVPYGKDNLRRNIQRVRELNISAEEKALILGQNIQRILCDR
ncbi:MAG TPA: TatD family hydrolase [Anaerolineales bacterium]|nr:TatD family hydrolase [Anaerolineales bacterium]